ncbi:hypothetical protein [Yinghuangia sp. YIM S09857]
MIDPASPIAVQPRLRQDLAVDQVDWDALSERTASCSDLEVAGVRAR